METQSEKNQNLLVDPGKIKEQRFLEKVKEHKKKIAVGAVAVLTMVAAGFGVKNREAFISAIKASHIEEVLTNNLETGNKTIPLIPESDSQSFTNDSRNINVKEHVRNLSEGRNASISKVESAAKNGYYLEGNQTWVTAHSKRSA